MSSKYETIKIINFMVIEIQNIVLSGVVGKTIICFKRHISSNHNLKEI